MTPAQAGKLKALARRREHDYIEAQREEIEIGQMVRTLIKKSPLEKGATPNWSREVNEVLGYAPPKRVILWTPSGDVIKKSVDEIRESKFRREPAAPPPSRQTREHLGRAVRVRQEERREGIDRGNILRGRTRAEGRRTRSQRRNNLN
jgi:hypothetical protein